jgi:hypothetical protein
LHLEQLETRALPASAQPLPIFHTVDSYNWSGYAAATNLTSPASNAVTTVSGSWTVPSVSGKANAYSSVWVGIDGYSSSSVEQLGTEQDTSKTGKATYYAWWEMYPNPSQRIPGMTISPGDSMYASVKYSSGQFTLYMKDNSTDVSFTTGQSAMADRSSAEWVVEAPSSFSGILPLANFGTATFSAAQATINGTTGAIDNSSWQNTAINMVNSSGTVIDQTSGLTDTTTAPITSSFSVTFSGSSGGGGHGHGHGHGPLQAVEFVVPIGTAFQAPANPVALQNPPLEYPAASAGQDAIVSTPAADAFFAQLQSPESTSAPKTTWGAVQPDTPHGALGSDILGLVEVGQTL